MKFFSPHQKTTNRLLFILLVCCGIHTRLIAQKDITAFGKISIADFDVTPGSEKNAPAIVLCEEEELEFGWNNVRFFFNMYSKRRVRIKILNESGLKYANVKIVYFNDDEYERITDISGYTYNMESAEDIKITKLAKEQVYKQKIDDEFSSVAFALPQVKTGSIIEYRYTTIRETYSYIPNWLFQREIPVQYSRFSMEIPEYFQYASDLKNYEHPFEKKETKSKSVFPATGGAIVANATQYTYVMRNLPAITDEPYMSSIKDYQAGIRVQLSRYIGPNGRIVDFANSWQKLWFYLKESPYLGQQIKKKIIIPELEAALAKTDTTETAKMHCIHRFMRTRFEWNGSKGYQCYDIKKVAEIRKGNTGDLNLLFINLLQSAGLQALPVLASTRNNGRVNTLYPFLRQFDVLLTMVTVNGKTHIVDAANPYNPSRLIPDDVLGNEGLVLGATEPYWIDLWDKMAEEKQSVSLVCRVNDAALLEGEAFVSSFDYARLKRSSAAREGNEKFIEAHLKQSQYDVKVQDLELRNLDNDSLSLDQKFSFSIPLGQSGQYSYFSLNLFTGLERNPFIAETRLTHIEFGSNRTLLLKCQVSISPQYEIEELPKNITLMMPDSSISFTRQIQKQENILSVRMRLEFKRPIFLAAEYEEFREFYKLLFAKLNEQIVLKRKT